MAITDSPTTLSLKAGPRAYAHIRANGHLGERWLTL